MKNMQTTIGTFRPVHIGEDGYMATAGRVNFMMPSNRKIKVEPFDLVRVRWWVDNDGVTIADSVEVLDQADIESALHQQEQAEPTEYHAWAVVDAIDHDHANISDTVGYVFKALKVYHAMSAAPQPKETGE